MKQPRPHMHWYNRTNKQKPTTAKKQPNIHSGLGACGLLCGNIAITGQLPISQAEGPRYIGLVRVVRMHMHDYMCLAFLEGGVRHFSA